MIYQRYGNPDMLIDRMLVTCQFYKFCIDAVKAYNKDWKEAREWEAWLHKIHSKTWEEFCSSKETSIDKKQVAQQLRDIRKMVSTVSWSI